MIRWTEQTDVYRMDCSHRLEALISGALAVGMMLVTTIGIIGTLATLDGGSWRSTLAFLVLVAIGGLVAWLAGRGAATYRTMTAWVEVSVRGCRAQWGGPALPPMGAPIPVAHFRLFFDARTRVGIEAVLPEGVPLRLFGPWTVDDPGRLIRATDELNANLGSVESSAATIVPPSARLDGPPNAAMRKTLDDWARRPGPYRLVVVDGRWPITTPVIAFLFAVSFYAWRATQLPREFILVVTGFGALLALWWGLSERHVHWIELDAPGRRTSWGRGREMLGAEVVIASFHAEPCPSFLGRDDRWMIVAYHTDGQRIVPFGGELRVPRRRAIRSAYLLNWALRAAVDESGAAPMSSSR